MLLFVEEKFSLPHHWSLLDRTAVDALNAALLLLKMEGDQFEEQCQETWADKDGNLTPIGQKIFNEINKMPVRGFQVTTEEKMLEYLCTAKDTQGRMVNKNVTGPKADTLGSRFGLCTCGIMQMDSVPCIHMAAVAKSSMMPGFNMDNDAILVDDRTVASSAST
jgi:hypothetical protein